MRGGRPVRSPFRSSQLAGNAGLTMQILRQRRRHDTFVGNGFNQDVRLAVACGVRYRPTYRRRMRPGRSSKISGEQERVRPQKIYENQKLPVNREIRKRGAGRHERMMSGIDLAAPVTNGKARWPRQPRGRSTGLYLLGRVRLFSLKLSGHPSARKKAPAPIEPGGSSGAGRVPGTQMQKQPDCSPSWRHHDQPHLEGVRSSRQSTALRYVPIAPSCRQIEWPISGRL
jgi:hypothetical protein